MFGQCCTHSEGRRDADGGDVVHGVVHTHWEHFGHDANLDCISAWQCYATHANYRHDDDYNLHDDTHGVNHNDDRVHNLLHRVLKCDFFR